MVIGVIGNLYRLPYSTLIGRVFLVYHYKENKMRCPSCRKRKATVTVDDKHFGEVKVCEKCRREYYPTLEEQVDDDLQEMYRAERAAGFASVGDYW